MERYGCVCVCMYVDATLLHPFYGELLVPNHALSKYLWWMVVHLEIIISQCLFIFAKLVWITNIKIRVIYCYLVYVCVLFFVVSKRFLCACCPKCGAIYDRVFILTSFVIFHSFISDDVAAVNAFPPMSLLNLATGARKKLRWFFHATNL